MALALAATDERLVPDIPSIQVIYRKFDILAIEAGWAERRKHAKIRNVVKYLVIVVKNYNELLGRQSPQHTSNYVTSSLPLPELYLSSKSL